MKHNEIVVAEESLRLAMLNSDIAQLKKLISDDLLFTNHFGVVVTKEEDINIHQRGILKFNDIRLSNQNIKIHPQFAVVSVEAKISAVFDNQPANGNFMFTRVWSNQSEGLKVIAGQVTQKMS